MYHELIPDQFRRRSKSPKVSVPSSKSVSLIHRAWLSAPLLFCIANWGSWFHFFLRKLTSIMGYFCQAMLHYHWVLLPGCACAILSWGTVARLCYTILGYCCQAVLYYHGILLPGCAILSWGTVARLCYTIMEYCCQAMLYYHEVLLPGYAILSWATVAMWYPQACFLCKPWVSVVATGSILILKLELQLQQQLCPNLLTTKLDSQPLPTSQLRRKLYID